MAQSNYVKQKQMRVLLRDQIDFARAESTQSGRYTEIKQHCISESISQPLSFYTPYFQPNQKTIWNIRFQTANCPNVLCPEE